MSVSTIFTEALRVVADMWPILLVLSQDEELSKDNPDECFADGDLRAYLNKSGKSRKKKAPELAAK
jgi:hypothetical protein